MEQLIEIDFIKNWELRTENEITACDFLFPIVLGVPAKTIAGDIIPFNPNNEDDVKSWQDSLTKIFKLVEVDFKNKKT